MPLLCRSAAVSRWSPSRSHVATKLTSRYISVIHRDNRKRVSQIWVPTGGVTPAAEESNDSISLLVRAGFLRQAYSGVFHLLPLGLRVQDKIIALVDKHMQSLGANKVSLATITSEALWRRSGRYTGNNPEMFQLSTPKPTGFLLSPTHEEEITNVVANAITSYKDLPLRLYQVSRKYRNELRPRGGLLRTREFLMKDLYTFDVSPSAALETYAAVKRAYEAFFTEIGIPFLVADADSGDMGGDLSHEFHFATPAGEDTVISCEGCGWALNEELAAARGVVREEGEGDGWGSCLKCGTGKLKGQRAVELGHTFYLGTRYSEPLDCTVDVPSTSTTTTTTTTASNSTPAPPTRTPLSMGCHGIGISRLLGAITTLLSTPSLPTTTTSPPSPSSNPPAAATPGLTWPRPLSPHDVLILPALRTPTISTDAEKIYDLLTAESVGGLPIDALLDDRTDVGVGWKLKDAEMVGYPVVVVVGRGWSEGKVEVTCRRLGLREEVAVEGGEMLGFVGWCLARC